MGQLNLTKQSVKGGMIKNENTAFVAVYNTNNRILSIENCTASGNEKVQRPEPIVIIYDGLNNPNEKIVFEGTHSDLVKLINKGRDL